MQEYCIKTASTICFVYLLESPQLGPKTVLYGNKNKKGLSYISFCPLRILYNSKFILMTTYSGTNTVVVKKILCTNIL